MEKTNEFEIVEINTFEELTKVKDAFENNDKVAIDIRNFSNRFCTFGRKR